MKNIIIGLMLMMVVGTSSAQLQIDPALQRVGLAMNALHTYHVNVIIDKTSDKSPEDIQEIMNHVNRTYSLARINFQVKSITTNYKPLLTNGFSRSLINLHHTNQYADLTIYVTSNASGDVIGRSTTNSISTDNAVLLVDLSFQNSLKDCSGIVMHEIGHLFGLTHGNNERYVMSADNNSDHSGIFTKGNLEKLKNL